MWRSFPSEDNLPELTALNFWQMFYYSCPTKLSSRRKSKACVQCSPSSNSKMKNLPLYQVKVLYNFINQFLLRWLAKHFLAPHPNLQFRSAQESFQRKSSRWWLTVLCGLIATKTQFRQGKCHKSCLLISPARSALWDLEKSRNCRNWNAAFWIRHDQAEKRWVVVL